jgi:tetratricopeptide (TPR) repeat protein
MPRLAKTCLIALLLALSPVQSGLFRAARAQSPSKESSRQQGSTGEKTQAPDQKQADYSQEAFVIEQLKTSYRFEKDGTGLREQSLRVKIQTEAGVENFGQLVFPYSSGNEKLEIERVSVRKADGGVVTASDSNIQDLTTPISRQSPVYTDLRQKHVTVPGLRPGDLLEYHVVWRITAPLAANHFWFEHDFLKSDLILLDEGLEVNIPQDSVVKLKTEPGLDPAVKEQNGRRLYTWKHSNLQRKKKDDKYDKEDAEKDDSDEPKPPQIQMTTFKSWDEVGQWYGVLQRERVMPDEKIRAKVAEQLRGLNGDLEKIEALYNYVAKNFRYVSLSFGQGRYQPHAAAEVLANQYGDCKDKHTLLASMLTAAGMRAHSALINSSRKIDPDIPSPAQFDHVITAIPLGKETLWVDTTTEVAPFRLLAPSLRKKQALLIPESGTARLETTPADLPFSSKELVEIEGKVNDLGAITGHSHFTLRGDSELYFRLMFRKTPKADWNRLGDYLSYASGLRAEISEVIPSEPGTTDKPFELEYDFSKTDFLEWSDKKTALRIPLPSLRLPYADEEKQESSKPIDLGAATEITYRLKISMPAKYRMRLPVPVKVTRDYADYQSSYKLEGNTLIVERALRVRQSEIPASRTQDYLAFRASAQADETQTLSVEADVAGSPSIPDSLKTEDLVKAADTAVNNHKYELAEEMLKRVLAKEPKHKSARRQLGYALFAQRKYAAAAEAVQEQTKLNPFDNYAYNLLGRIFWAQQKYEEAETAFRKQIEITPLDKWAHGNLGLMLVEWRKYKEAAPELEQGITLNPDQEHQYQINLGRAYLNLGEVDKAAAAFEKAVKLAPDPNTRNEVAYALSLSDIQLDKAQEYAESAVTEIGAKLRNAGLERLTPQNFAEVSSLGAYWDTLGWVHFKKGNLDIAEKYVRAAWLLAQHSEVGDHLGQISEKRGLKEEAIRWYSLAAVVRRPTPDAREHLALLVGKDKIEPHLNKAKESLTDFSIVKLGPLLKNEKEKLEAEFYVLFVPGASRTAQVADVKFIRGSEKLRPMAAALKGAKFRMTFPDETATKVIRRGTLVCPPQNGQSQPGECAFGLLPTEDVPPVD